MPQNAATDHVGGVVVVSAVKPSGDVCTSVDTSNSSAAPTTTVCNDEPLADAVDGGEMETSMTTTADVQVHEPQQRDSMGARHVRFDYHDFAAFVIIMTL